ncbi:hypothetical protein M3215_11520 [Bacillus cytotoxicus]|uniref:Uncharacterized protein n=1 Tax=Bacillus cytotoxicus TaxID=580165 RepID=A0ACC6A867_9BACI|nr:hypothetical protein [Bacillus cytotoxicus]
MIKISKVNSLVQEMLDSSAVGTIVEEAGPLVDAVGGFIQPLGAILNGYKMRKLKKRLDSVEPELLRIKNKIEEKENSIFLKQEVFPLILKYLSDEDEDDKTNIYINGFEYTIDEGIEEMEKVYHYFDVLADLRISDIVHLFERFSPKDANTLLKIKLYDVQRFSEDPAYREEIREQRDLKLYMDNKLVRLGLVNVEQPDPIKVIDEHLKHASRGLAGSRNDTIPQYKLTNFGSRFIEFFREED